MNRRRPKWLTYANVVSTMCLMLAFGGTSYAAYAIGSADVINESLTGTDIKNESVSGSELQNGSITPADLEPSQRTTSRRADSRNVRIAPDAIVASVVIPASAGQNIMVHVSGEVARMDYQHSVSQPIQCNITLLRPSGQIDPAAFSTYSVNLRTQDTYYGSPYGNLDQNPGYDPAPAWTTEDVARTRYNDQGTSFAVTTTGSYSVRYRCGVRGQLLSGVEVRAGALLEATAVNGTSVSTIS